MDDQPIVAILIGGPGDGRRLELQRELPLFRLPVSKPFLSPFTEGGSTCSIHKYAPRTLWPIAWPGPRHGGKIERLPDSCVVFYVHEGAE